MKFMRLYTGDDEQSHFETLEMKLDKAELGKLAIEQVDSIVFGEIDEPREIDWHNAPCSQYIIMLRGSVEIEVGDGSKEIFHEGDVLLADDLTGQGHITRAASEGVRHYLAIPKLT